LQVVVCNLLRTNWRKNKFKQFGYQINFQIRKKEEKRWSENELRVLTSTSVETFEQRHSGRRKNL
jgi:hypothetical protein